MSPFTRSAVSVLIAVSSVSAAGVFRSGVQAAASTDDNVLFQTDFDHPQEYEEAWYSASPQAGNIEVADGFLRAPSGQQITALLYLKPESVTMPVENYAVETRVRFRGAVGHNVHAGLFAQAETMEHVSDQFHTTLLDVSFHRNNIVRLRSKDGSENRSGDYGAPEFVPTDNVWYQLRLEIRDGRAWAYVDGDLVLDVANNRPAGPPGLRIWKVDRNAVIEYDFVRVELLQCPGCDEG